LQGGSTDGIGQAARFSNPDGVAIDSSGNFYIADTFNRRVTKSAPLAPFQFVSSTAGLNGSIEIRLMGPSGSSLVLESSLNLEDWLSVQTYSILPSGLDLAVSIGADPNRFFSARLLP